MRTTKFSLMALAAVAMSADVGVTGGTDAAETQSPDPAPINDFVTMSKATLHFKSEKLRDAEGKLAKGEDGKQLLGQKHPSVTIHLPVPKPERLVQFLTNDGGAFAKEQELVLSAVSAIVFGIARSQVNAFREANPEGVVTPAVLNYDKLDFTAIANMPKSERGSYVPSDEDLKAFTDSYLEVMPKATNKDVEKIKNHVDIITTGFKKQRGQKDILEFFQNALDVYIAAVPADTVEEHQEVIEYLQSRLARMLAVEEKVTMDDL